MLPALRMLVRKPFRLIAISFLFFLLCAFQVYLLKALPYSSSWMESAERDSSKPTPNFHVGSLNWNVEEYATDKNLSTFRAYFAKTCAGLKGLDAAVAITRDFEKRFAFGSPSTDFFAPRYDPLQEYRDHVEQGAPGHCVTYSGLMAAVLLSAGCPARVLQVYSTSGKGHNVIEVWDEKKGWVLLDPSLKNLLRVDEKAKTDSEQNPDLGSEATVIPVGKHKTLEEDVQPSFYNDTEDGVLRGPRVYPEPWLYLRCGPKAAIWPFRGEFMVIGRRPWSFGPFQHMLHAGIAGTFVLGAGSLVGAVALCLLGSRQRVISNSDPGQTCTA